MGFIISNTSNWYSYDRMIDDWTSEYFGENPVETSHTESNFSSKYGSSFTFQSEAPSFQIPEPGVIIEKIAADSSKNQSYTLKIAPSREINRLDIYETKDVDFEEFKVNGLEADEVYLGDNAFHMFKRRWRERLLTYYASNQDTLRIEFSIEKGDLPEFVLYESSYDLMGNKNLKVKDRPEAMIPRPFVLNDATILKKTIRIKD